MTFTTVNLTGDRVLVKGTDRFGTEGQAVLDATEWRKVQRHTAVIGAQETFDSEVEAFFAPLTQAAERLESVGSGPAPDPITYVVLHEGTEAQAGRDEVRAQLGNDSVVLRLIESGDTDRLVWVMDRLEVMQVEEPPADETYAQVEADEV